MNRGSAKDVVYGHATAAWDAACTSLGIAGAQLRYKDDGLEEPPLGTYWARMSMQTVDERQETLRNAEFVRRFVTVGLIFVKIHAPRTDNDAQENIDILSEAIRNAFRDPRVDNNLEFTQAAIDDSVRPEPAWMPIMITARFWYRQFM